MEIVEEASLHAVGAQEAGEQRKRAALIREHSAPETAFGAPRDFLENRFVYAVVSPRARGLSVGVNMNPDKTCNFNCVYC